MTVHEQVIMLKSKIQHLKQELIDFESELYKLEHLPEYNKFTSMGYAETIIYSKLEAEARKDCEGSYNYGSSQYTQQFYVNDVLYEGVLNVEYNKYYVENTDFKVEKVIDANQV